MLHLSLALLYSEEWQSSKAPGSWALIAAALPLHATGRGVNSKAKWMTKNRLTALLLGTNRAMEYSTPF